MSNSEMRANYDPGTDAPAEGPDSGSHELRAILDAIAAQLSDADRRHSATLNEMQARIADMGREAETLRTRLPGQFESAFERIETGMAELAQRLSGPGAVGGDVGSAIFAHTTGRETPTHDFQHGDAGKGDTPMALRSAHEPNDGGIRRREEEASRRASSGVDTFDVIESSVPGNVSDPWDRDAAEALTGLYESGAASFAPQSSFNGSGAGSGLAGKRDFMFDSNTETSSAPGSTSGVAGGFGTIDQSWLENRFAEIARGIEQSLAEIRPDHGFYAIGQRLDRFEQQFAKMFEGVATQADIGAVRLIEEHVGEVVNHLVQTHDQLARLNVIEEQLAVISHTLAEVQGVAGISEQGHEVGYAAPRLDVDAIARAAAEHTAQRFADMRPVDRDSAADELRPLIERMRSESRQGEENTTALLDTLQQAMIRLLDRVDAIEYSQQQGFSLPQPTAHEHIFGTPRFASEADLRPAFIGDDEHQAGALDAAVAAVASSQTPSRPSESFTIGTAGAAMGERPLDVPSSRDDKRRQDFIAEARRAKMRLASSDRDQVVISAPASGSVTADIGSGVAPGNRPIRPPTSVAKPSGPTAPSARLMIIAAIALLALGSLWYTLGSGSDKSASIEPAAPAQPASANGAAPASSNGAVKPATGSTELPDSTGKAADPAPDANGRRGDTAPIDGTQGRIMQSAAPTTTLPLLGVAVDINQPVTEADIVQARRHEAMATMSGRLGDAAARSSNPAFMPASMVPSEAETEVPQTASAQASAGPTSVQTSGQASGQASAQTLGQNGTDDIPDGSSRSTQLDMPPASVGPLSLRLAAANGDPSAEFEVGARLAEGKGTSQNFKDAAKWYQRSADHGFPQAEYRLGTLYERGLGLKSDRALAAAWYQRAAQQGNIKSMHNLAVLSANQNDQSPDYTTAAQWFEEAAKRGLPDSQFNLAVLYENGLGVKRDMKQAFMWVSIAARDGDADAIKRRDILRGKLTAAEITAAEQMVASWKALPYDRDVNDAHSAGEAWKKNPKNGVDG